MRRFCKNLLVVTTLCSPVCAFAQNPAANSDNAMMRVIGLALDNIDRAVCGGQSCAPTTAEEKAAPPLTVVEARMVFERGAISAAGEHCGLDWRKLNFVPLTEHWRSKQAPVRKMALIVLIHGISQGIGQGEARTLGPCTDAMRRNIETRLAFRPS